MTTPQILFQGLSFGEGPRWHDGRLWMSDFHTHRVLGRDRARSIVETAQQLGCHHLVMGTARKNSLTRMVEDSVTDRVLELTTLPVEVIAGDAVSKLERFGIPAGIALGVGLLVLATD